MDIIFNSPSCELNETKALFIQNWRSGGSSLSSLFASNFGHKYLKIGSQFNDTGWPQYSLPELGQLGEVRERVQEASILGGHLCVGIEALMPGNWDTWMSVRRPFERLRSAVLRFYSSSFSGIDDELKSSPDNVRSHSERVIVDLLRGPLRHEINGISRRLAGFSVAASVSADLQTDLEQISTFEANSNHEVLLKSAQANLRNVDLIFIPEYLHAGIVCIERIYNQPPLINLFSGLRHNSILNGKASKSELKVFSKAEPLLEKLCLVDQILWDDLLRRFNHQLRLCKVAKKDVALRQALHESPIIDVQHVGKGLAVDEVIEHISLSLAERARKFPELSEPLISIAANWSRFHPSAREEIQSRSTHYFRRGSIA